MTDLHMPILRRARADDWETVRALLLESGLPVEDLGPDRLDRFLVAEDGAEIAGLIGLEIHGRIGLLRSLVVASGARKAGLGGKLVGALEAAAQAAGLRELWLLTIDAAPFFERQGFAVADRASAPDSIRNTEEFRTLCPDDSRLMTKALER